MKHVVIKLLTLTLDACAKCLIQSKVKFNGKFGCSYCLHFGCRTNSKDNIYRFPLIDGIPKETTKIR